MRIVSEARTEDSRSREAWDAIWRSEEGGAPRVPGRLERMGGFTRLILQVLEGLSPCSGGRILEAGCGSASIMRILVGRGFRCSGLDTSPAAARNALRSGASAACASVTDIPFRTGSFDAAYSVGLFDLLSPVSAGRGLSELARAVRPGGRIVLIDNSARSAVHRFVMSTLMRRGKWRWGEKAAFTTLVPGVLDAIPGALCSEAELGFLQQLRFLAFLLPGGKLPARIFHLFFYILNWLAWPLNSRPGMILVTEVTLPAETAGDGRPTDSDG